MLLSERLRTVRNILEEHGWRKGQFRGPNGYCLEGAILAATGINVPCGVSSFEFLGATEESWKVYHFLNEIKNEMWDSHTLWHFNDAHTVKEVYALIDLAIKRAQEQEGTQKEVKEEKVLVSV